jgi:hypothetical protein
LRFDHNVCRFYTTKHIVGKPNGYFATFWPQIEQHDGMLQQHNKAQLTVPGNTLI